MPLVSIIIPNYNNSKWLSSCIESCLLQEGNFQKEIIVVDDQSTDDSWRILEEYQSNYPSEVFIYKNPSKGGNQARNFGFTKASGDYIQWLDSDDLLLPGKLATQLKFLVAHSNLDIAYSDWRMDFYEGAVKTREEVRIEKKYNSFLKALVEDRWLPNNSYLLKRSIAKRLHEIQAWNPKRKVGQDREYFTMAAIIGARFTYVLGVFSVYNRWSSKSVSSINFKFRLKLNQDLELKFMESIVAEEWISPPDKKELLALLKTHGLKACYYHPKLRLLSPMSFFEIKWGIIHKKMRVVIPFIWGFQTVSYYVNSISKS
tara:strand:+ start:1274 stop:2221 length:948 start_codon:yes stop_codon:yes gene_type:complete